MEMTVLAHSRLESASPNVVHADSNVNTRIPYVILVHQSPCSILPKAQFPSPNFLGDVVDVVQPF